MGTKFLAPMLAAATKGLGMAEVLHWLDSREDQEVKDILARPGARGGCLGVEPVPHRPGRTRCMPRPRRSWPSTATSASRPPPTATTWTWTSS